MAVDVDISRTSAHVCQADSLAGASTRMPRMLDLIVRAREKLRRDGARQALARVLRFITTSSNSSGLHAVGAVSQPPLPLENSIEALGLMPGDWVEVKSLPEILSTLDARRKLHGLEFLPGMQPFCGKRFKVLKRMATLYQEESGQVRRLKNTVLLTDVQCDGLLMKCDRSCYLFWREAWLRRVDSEHGIPTAEFPDQH